MRKKLSGLRAFLFAGLLLPGTPVLGAEAQKNLHLTARILPRVSLSLSHSHLTLVGSEDQPVIPSQEGPVQITARGRISGGQPLVLSIGAARDLEGPSGRIPLEQVDWTSQGEGWRSGSLSRNGQQSMGRWNRSGVYQGQVSFVLKNQGNLIPGDYGASVTLTLASP
ncbi:MAG: hypothetical protein FJ134_00535 [Deltaproteobacteria bacterium]|nr:hypothetical protein [Deltaproteobacteria bacterium]